MYTHKHISSRVCKCVRWCSWKHLVFRRQRFDYHFYYTALTLSSGGIQSLLCLHTGKKHCFCYVNSLMTLLAFTVVSYSITSCKHGYWPSASLGDPIMINFTTLCSIATVSCSADEEETEGIGCVLWLMIFALLLVLLIPASINSDMVGNHTEQYV